MISVHTAGRKLRAERLVPRFEPGGHRVDAGGARAVRLIGGAVYRMRFLLSADDKKYLVVKNTLKIFSKI